MRDNAPVTVPASVSLSVPVPAAVRPTNGCNGTSGTAAANCAGDARLAGAYGLDPRARANSAACHTARSRGPWHPICTPLPPCRSRPPQPGRQPSHICCPPAHRPSAAADLEDPWLKTLA